MKRLADLECPSWFWILLGVALAVSRPSAPPREFATADLDSRLPYPSGGSGADATETPVRAMRQISGIGQVRALAIARARWAAERESSPFVLLDVPGIGPSVAAQWAAWNASRGSNREGQ